MYVCTCLWIKAQGQRQVNALLKNVSVEYKCSMLRDKDVERRLMSNSSKCHIQTQNNAKNGMQYGNTKFMGELYVTFILRRVDAPKLVRLRAFETRYICISYSTFVFRHLFNVFFYSYIRGVDQVVLVFRVYVTLPCHR